ncbi:GspH/FimT family protein [Endozoicomonas sp. 8E]|uniref:GspH/FimT family pseudopilin n=1 Tax=Endozoicomonas sp. 8E TaxID=3035692 RepID=UPI00293904E4|nr:GspH/FimT family protein [Endozoicomonas sp. 8E]WOG26419.1 GspH/FimT family protein [Endozoicomonas sp. 8E]
MFRRSFAITRPRTMKGLTLIEMMITILLVGIIGSMTVSLDSLVQSFRMDFYNQRVFSSMVVARSEAIKRGVNVSLCRSQNGFSCDTSDSNWKAGWMVFVNPNNNSSVDPGEIVIRVYEEIDREVTINLNTGNTVTFTPRGSPSVVRTIRVCPTGGLAAPIKTVSVTTTGQIRKTSSTGNC